MDTPDAATTARRLGGALEPVIGQVYFSPECHRRYVDLGFDASPADSGGVALPDGPAYMTSRGSLMGQVRGEVVAAAFAVFDPKVVVPGVEHGWTLTDADTICAARDAGALEQLERVLGADPDGRERVEELLVRASDGLRIGGRPLAAGISALDAPDHPLGVIWRRGDLLREYRGDSHTAAWVDAGLDAVQIGLLTELFWGLPQRSYARTRGWSDADFDHATETLRTRGALDADGGFTEAGRELREGVEVRTDEQMRPVLDALGDDAEELIELLLPWGRAVRAAAGYLASGPHDLADRDDRAAPS
ncbi:SCO6745 family protein [Ilumatobacter sp.]|uniref:SCO6745 family protein n=1 Tax=Ilumatobacter sp. TaxID=1967498 RepID=UPI003B530117